MPKSHSAYRLLAIFGLLASLAACKPDYPNCDNDTDCQIEGQADVCFNGACQECIEDTQCVAKSGDGYTCLQGRCEAPQNKRPEKSAVKTETALTVSSAKRMFAKTPMPLHRPT